MKKIFNVSPKYVLSLCAALLVALAVLSSKPNNSKFLTLDALLSDIFLMSQAMDFELLKTRAGLNQNYESISGLADNVLRAMGSLTQVSRDSSAKNNRRANAPSVGSESEFYRPSKGLDAGLKQRIAIIEQFKTQFSIYQDSRAEVFQLIDQLRSFITPQQDWQSMVAELERLALQSDRLETAGNEYELFPLVDRLKSQSFTDAQRSMLVELEQHLRNVARYLPQIQVSVASALALSVEFNNSIQQLKNSISDAHQVELNVAKMYFAGLVLVASLTLFYGLWQALRMLTNSSLIQKQNRMLESRVEQRTEEMSSLLDKLQAETSDKQKIIEDMDRKTEEMETREAFFRSITETAADPIILINEEGYITFANAATYNLFEKEQYRVLGDSVATLLPGVNNASALLNCDKKEVLGESSAGQSLTIRYSINKIDLNMDESFYAVIMHDISDFVRLESDLAHAQKLESVGQLAAGIAHEINTPAQFISDNLSFLIESIGELFELVEEVNQLVGEEPEAGELAEIHQLIADADIEYLSEEVPSALKQSAEGIQRVATIVKAMKDYSHPGENMDFADINAAILSTVTVSRGEWKYLAELETDLDEELPLVQCVVSDVNQIVLNMVVNSAHAIDDKFSGQQEKTGLIKVTTRGAEDHIVITIGDNGNGMPEHVKEKIFDHFFTTKGVGKGTGQGLSIAHKLIAQKHSGTVSVDSVEGEGTTFTITLPLKQVEKETESDTAEDIFDEVQMKAG